MPWAGGGGPLISASREMALSGRSTSFSPAKKEGNRLRRSSKRAASSWRGKQTRQAQNDRKQFIPQPAATSSQPTFNSFSRAGSFHSTRQQSRDFLSTFSFFEKKRHFTLIRSRFVHVHSLDFLKKMAESTNWTAADARDVASVGCKTAPTR